MLTDEEILKARTNATGKNQDRRIASDRAVARAAWAKARAEALDEADEIGSTLWNNLVLDDEFGAPWGQAITIYRDKIRALKDEG